MAEQQYRYRGRGYSARYVYGSAARAQEVPDIRKAPEKKEQKKEKTRVVREARVQVERKVQENRKLSPALSLAQTAVIFVAASMLVAAGAFYILEMSLFRTAGKQTASLESEIVSVEEENTLLKNAREEELDYDSVYEFAVASGMQNPEKRQIIRYRADLEEYVAKNGEIPNEQK